jgi:two-component system sensor histidine kinase UhpB
MSLRIRLNLLITLLFIGLFICSSFYVIANARKAVQHEVESTAQLALQLIQIAISSVSMEAEEQDKLKILDSLSSLDETRHLRIEIRNPADVLMPDEEFSIIENAKAPDWFVKLVQPPPTEIRRWLNSPAIAPTGVIIRADPTDEIDENWSEVRSILIALSVFIVLANMLVYITIGKYLAPIKTVLAGLSGIEQGNYQLELPHFRLPELDRISQQFNHMARVLSESKAKNQLLTQRSLEIQEEERRHLAQELHDELGQTIAAIKAVAAATINSPESDQKQVTTSLNTIIEYSDHIYQVAKNMMSRLRPSVLDEFGLVKALQTMIDDWNSLQDDIFCHFSFSNMPSDLSDSLNIHLFRIVQESLTNVLKHSSASKVFITLNKTKCSGIDHIHLKVQDDGIGLDEQAVTTGMGLPGMKERVEMNDGVFVITSEVGKGLTIEIYIPI